MVGPSSGGSNSYDNELQAGQKLYDRRFNNSEPMYNTANPQQQHHHQEQHGRQGHANGGNGHLNATHHSSQHPHHQPHLGNAGVGRSASPAPSSASDASRIKEKKKLKNLFSSKK